jgi:RHS repeat-associated protein
LTSETQTIAGYAFAVGYAYTTNDQVQTITYPNGKQASRTYTDRRQLATVGFDGAAVATRSYDDGGRLTYTALGNGTAETRTYLAGDNLVASIVVPGVTNFSSYTYDANRRKTYEGHQFAADLQTFGYDHENRLTSWTRDGVESQTWTLSKVGDWQATTRNGTTQTRTHSDVHETTGITTGGITTPLAYDKKGNLATDQAGQGYVWDHENRLITAVVGAATSGYLYDALGRRLAKSAGGILTTFVHDGAQVIAEYEAPLYQSSDIGSPALAGSFSDPGTGTVTVSASGADIWNTSDQFRYAYFTLTGDGSLTAKVTSQTNTDGWAKAGVMLRDSLAANAIHAMTCVTPGNGVAFQRRLATGGTSSNNHTGGGSAALPHWVRITRTGTTVSGYRSADGITWTLAASDTVTFSQATIYAGLAVTAHTNAAVSTATFINVSLTGAITTTSSPVYARGYVYGSYVDEVLAILPASGLAADRKFVHGNHLYSVAALTDNSGNVVERYRYDAYGNRTVLAADGITVRTSSQHGNQVGFTGRYLDEETGLWYFRSRLYSPNAGRFTRRENLGYIDGLNLYSAFFVPNELDPTGEIIRSRCPIDDYVKNHVPTYKREELPEEFKYKYTNGEGAGPRGEILEGMMNEDHSFFVAGSLPNDCIANTKAHVEARVRIVASAMAANFGWPGAGDNPVPPDRLPGESATDYFNRINNNNTCLYCFRATQIAFGTGLAPGDTAASRNRSLWIPGDWGYIENTNWRQGTWSRGLEGENIIRVFRGNFWGHPVGVKPLAEWLNVISGWTSNDGTTTGSPRVLVEVKYPSTGLEVP